MIYVMSDIHGKYDKFIKMLELIEFSESDELYILGDIFDRGENSILIFDYVLTHKNIHLIRGNHEQMFLDWYDGIDGSLWTGCNGGYDTLNQIIDIQEKVQFNYINELYKRINKLPLYKILEVNGNKFILVHAGLKFDNKNTDCSVEDFMLSQDKEVLLWDRSNIYSNKQFQDYTTIQGHTTVQYISKKLEKFNIKVPNDRIINRGGNIYIDCGACFTDGKLACLRLDDMEEFYID